MAKPTKGKKPVDKNAKKGKGGKPSFLDRFKKKK